MVLQCFTNPSASQLLTLRAIQLGKRMTDGHTRNQRRDPKGSCIKIGATQRPFAPWISHPFLYEGYTIPSV